MRFRLILCAAAASACASHGADSVSVPAIPFGRVIARVGATPVVGAWGPDSVVAVYNPDTGTLQIDAGRVRGRRVPDVRVLLSCAAVPAPGVYPITGNPRALVQVQAVLDDASAGAWGGRGSSPRVFVADAAMPGVLELDTLDVAGGRVAGRFRAAVRDIDHTSGAALPMSGTFWGRVRTIDVPQFGGRAGGHLLSASERDCVAIRRPLPAGPATARPAVSAATSNETLQLSGTPGRPAAPAVTVTRAVQRASKARS